MSAREADLAEVSPAELREAMGHFATGVTVITSAGPNGDGSAPLLFWRGKYASISGQVPA